jgi:RNA polymerase sigma factor (sigma-70 family)
MRTRIPHLPHLIRSAAPSADLVPDHALLGEFVAAKSGIAFELLVRRHGPAVWAVCRRHLGNEHDAEDAFQATFLVLAKSAWRIARHASVGGWLYGVAYRVALKARRTSARRKRIETVVSPTDEPTTLPVHPFADTTAIVHAELEKLPDRYRLPLLLCDLEGLSRKEASAQLGWREGTLSGRLNRARKLLADRLTVRGIAAGVLATVGTATVPPALATTAAAVGVGLSVIGTTSTAAPETVAALAHGAMRDMTRSFVLKTAGVVLAASVLLGGGLLGVRFDTAPQATAAPVPKVEMAKAEDVTEALAEMLGLPAVQRELKLSADQRVRLIDGFEKLLEELEKNGRPVNPRNWGGQAPPSPSDWAAWEKYEAGVQELVAGTVTKGQFARLRQCEVQALGGRAVLLPRVAAVLDLSDEQKELAKQLRAALDRRGLVILEDANNPRKGLEQLATEVIDGFTPTQQKRWKELTGEKVTFNRERVTDRCPGLFAQLAPVAPPTAAPDGGPQPALPLPPLVPLPGAGGQPPPPPANPGK